MTMNVPRAMRPALVAAALLLASASAHAVASFELPPTVDASGLLPPQTMKGPHHEVQPQVESDGFLHLYAINTPWGVLRAASTAQAIQYAAEVEAAAAMEQVRGTDEFKGGVKDAAGDVLEGTSALVRNPVGSVKGAVSGVGAMFARSKEAIVSGGAKGAEEDSVTANVIGYSKVKREYAYEYGVDVYSRNPYLQQQLDALSKAGYAGNIAAKLALAIPSGGGGAYVSITSSTQSLNETFRDMPALELRKRNRARLDAMQVDPLVAEVYIANDVLTPREQTEIVEALASMNGTEERGVLLRHAIFTDNADVAYFRTRQAGMYADYYRHVAPIKRFVPVGEIAVGQKDDGTLVFCAPLDMLYWTEEMATFVSVLEGNLSAMPDIKRKELWLAGGISPMARQALEARGWTLNVNNAGQPVAAR